MESRPKQPKYARNKNIVVIGGSGSGKTRFFVKPSVMQMNCSMVITDPKGTLIEECGKMLAKGPPKKDKNGNIMKDKSGKVVHEPYVIKVLNTINFSKSLHYNPFAYIRSEKDILKLVNLLKRDGNNHCEYQRRREKRINLISQDKKSFVLMMKWNWKAICTSAINHYGDTVTTFNL